MSRILICGGAGFIGSHIVDLCLAKGHQVMVIDDLSSGRLENIPDLPKKSFKQMTISDAHGLLKAVEEFQPDAISHQAAQPSLRRSIEMPDYDAQINIIGTLNVIAAAKSVGARLVFASTSAVYDPGAVVPFLEDDPISPNLPYGIAKASAEMYIVHSGLSHAILRYGNVYGPRQVPVGENQLVPHCLNHVLRGDRFVINGDGEQARDFVYVEDIARANLLAMQSQMNGIFNCGSGKLTTINDVCYKISTMVGQVNPWLLVFEHGPAKVGEMRRSALDSTLAANCLGWEATTPLEVGLQKTIDWYRGQ